MLAPSMENCQRRPVAREVCLYYLVQPAMIRDQRFEREDVTETENESCAMQVLHALNGMPTWKPQYQCRILTIIVEMMCNGSGRTAVAAVNSALQLCMQVYGAAEETSVRLASRAAISQILCSFCAPENPHQEDSAQEKIAIYMDATSVLDSAIKKTSSLGHHSEQTVILLDAIYSILSSQTTAVQNHQPFISVIWQELCPCLMKLLGEPVKGARDLSGGSDEPLGRGQSAVVALNKSIFESPEAARSLYQILEQILRLLAPLSSMRTVLEAVFHKALLYPKVEQRAEALRLIRKVSIPSHLGAFLDSAFPYKIDEGIKRTLGASFESVDGEQRIGSNNTVESCPRGDAEDLTDDVAKKISENSTDSIDEMSKRLRCLAKKIESRNGISLDECQPCESTDEEEMETAKCFVNELESRLPNWMLLKSTIEVDEAIQGFASAFFSDYDGRDHRIMSDVRRIQKVVGVLSDHCVAARRISRWLLTASWDAFLASISRFVISRDKQRRILRPKLAEAMDYALRAMHALAYISVTLGYLGIGNRSGWIFERLVEMSCPVEELRETSAREKTNASGDRLAKWPLRRVDALSMQIVLDTALECALHAPECWKHIIRCTEYVWEIEKYLFGTTAQEQNNRWSLWKKKATKAPVEEQLCAEQSVEDVLKGNTSDVFDSHLAARVLCILIAKTDSFYESVGKNLNLPSLCELMRSLVAASESRLQFSMQKSVALTDPASIMHRIAFIILRLSPRPLVHLMKVWASITYHFVQCACVREDEQLTRASIGCLNDCVSGLLISEPNGFCFNQMLFRPFQDILCGDMCSEESQDQIVSLLASFVHTRPDEIGSGWRPLFGALRALRTSPLNESDAVSSGISSVQATVLDVFSTYLNIRNANVLTATLLDYVTCVLHYLQATESNFGESCQDFEVASTALQCLLKVENIVHDLMVKADSAVPHLLHRLRLRLLLRERVCENIDASIEPSYIVAPLSSVLLDDPFFDCTYHSPLPTDLDCLLQPSSEAVPWSSLGGVGRSCVELHLSLVEGLTAVAVTCPASLQSRLLHTIAETISSLINSKFGVDYGSYALSSLIFPVLQQWIRRETADSEVNLKQAIGLFTEVAVTYINTSNGEQL
ncbi:Brefeldin A-inhibited guanine nucleotide-exchange protein 3 [Toxocara canis]|uniref:Brefeldin A-inhibited guanine nucleotide-exchange protein 3 n=1 Tax=Toxocara canis TaxID=6265 RepID=A0A0B2VR71_TOXCA|nr:Brefeldin A-inhibited guanine nucleotide-exchange protein 3 [Toxocara canis]